MSSPKSRNEPFFIGKQCYECINCGTLVEFEWHEDDSCSCEEEEPAQVKVEKLVEEKEIVNSNLPL